MVNNSKAPFYKFQESYPVTHAMASVMRYTFFFFALYFFSVNTFFKSAGPISPSDGIGGTDKVLVMR